MYLETMEEILPKIQKIIIPDAKSGNLINLLNLKPQGDK